MEGYNVQGSGIAPNNGNNESDGPKVFSSAGAGRFQFESKPIELTPEQKAKQIKAKKRNKIIKWTILLVLLATAITFAVIFTIRAINQHRIDTAPVSQEEVDSIAAEANELANNPLSIDVINKVNEALHKIESAGRQDFDQNYPKLLSYKMQLINNNFTVAGVPIDQFEEAYRKTLEFGSVVDQWNAHTSAVTFYESTLNFQEEIKSLETMIGLIDDGTWSREVNPYMNPESERAIWQKALDVTRGELGEQQAFDEGRMMEETGNDQNNQ